MLAIRRLAALARSYLVCVPCLRGTSRDHKNSSNSLVAHANHGGKNQDPAGCEQMYWMRQCSNVIEAVAFAKLIDLPPSGASHDPLEPHRHR